MLANVEGDFRHARFSRWRGAQVPNLPEFFVEQEFCTQCGDCINLLPQAFRKVEDEEVAEVYAPLDESQRPELEKLMADCAGHAIQWK